MCMYLGLSELSKVGFYLIIQATSNGLPKIDTISRPGDGSRLLGLMLYVTSADALVRDYCFPPKPPPSCRLTRQQVTVGNLR